TVGLDRHHDHPPKTAIRMADAQRHWNAPTAGYAAQHRLIHKQNVGPVILLLSDEEISVRIVDLAAPRLAAMNNGTGFIHHTYDGEHSLSDDAFLDPLGQIQLALLKILTADETGNLLCRL